MTDPLAYIATPSRSLMARIRQWFDRRARQAAFAELDDDRLRDIDLSHEDIRRVRAGLSATNDLMDITRTDHDASRQIEALLPQRGRQ